MLNSFTSEEITARTPALRLGESVNTRASQMQRGEAGETCQLPLCVGGLFVYSGPAQIGREAFSAFQLIVRGLASDLLTVSVMYCRSLCLLAYCASRQISPHLTTSFKNLPWPEERVGGWSWCPWQAPSPQGGAEGVTGAIDTSLATSRC